MKQKPYFSPYHEMELSAEELRGADSEVQLSAMRFWFFANFEHPAERTPYESREGGYQWIWGGPYETAEELQNEFSGTVPDDLIEALVDELNAISREWGPAESADDYDDYLYQVISQQTESSSKFSSAILDIEKLLEMDAPTPVELTFLRLLFVNVISALETYLSDTFISAVANDDSLMRKYVETSPEFRGEKLSLSEVYKAREAIEQKARSTLIDIVWHNLGKVKPMYRDTLSVEFPDELGELSKAIVTRHDIVHRNGKTKDGIEVFVTKESINQLIQAVSALVRDIDSQLPLTNESAPKDEISFF